MSLPVSFQFRRNKRWPEGATVYQIYPRSFYDGNGDGIGDIGGITTKLKYLKDLGIKAIWLSPFYPSPMADFGYDVQDYCDVDPIFGTIQDMEKLIKSAHSKGLKILIDLVPNHSSDQHEWFRQSRQSRQDKYSDWYIWKDPKGFDPKGKPIPPNNWLDIFTGETAWEWEPARQQFYLHSFDVRQPDLNWENHDVREAIKSAMRFWLDKGVDGFRVDAVRFMGKNPKFTDNPKNPNFKPGNWSNYGSLKHINSQGWPQLFDYLNEMASVLKEKPYRKTPRFMVTESYPETHEAVSEYMEYYKKMDPEVAAPFNFEGLSLPWKAEPWNKFLKDFFKAIDAYSSHCVACFAFGNHDQARLATRLGSTVSRAAAVLLLTLPGMAFIYNGEEIGMENGNIPPELIQDPGAKGGSGRDPERTPLQWNAEKNAGFTTADSPWLPVNRNYMTNNILVQSKDPNSHYWLYRNLCNLRASSNILKSGTINTINTGDQNVLGYTRSVGKKCYLILINFSEQATAIKQIDNLKINRLVISSDPSTKHKKTKDLFIQLSANEAAVFSAKIS